VYVPDLCGVYYLEIAAVGMQLVRRGQ